MGTRVKKNRRIANRVRKYVWVDDSIEKSQSDKKVYKTYAEAINAAGGK